MREKRVCKYGEMYSRNRPWTKREEMRAENMRKCKLTYQDIANVLGRTYDNVYQHLNMKDINLKRKCNLIWKM